MCSVSPNKCLIVPAIILAILLGASNGACAGKGALVSKRHAPQADKQPDKSVLDDVAEGLENFKDRASRYSKDEWNFVLGYADYRHGNWKDAEEYFARVGDTLPQVSDHIAFYRAVISNRTGRPQDAIGFLDALKSGYPDSVWAAESLIERGRSLIALKRYSEARKNLNEYKNLIDGERSFDADKLILESMIGEGDADGAIRFARNLAVGADSESKLEELGTLFDEVKRRFKSDISGWLTEAPNQYRLAESFAGRSEWSEAAERLEKILGDKRLDDSFRTEAKWLLAKSLRSIHRYDEAIKLMEELLTRISHQFPTAAVDKPMSTASRSKKVLSIASAMPPRFFLRVPCSHGLLRRLVTETGEKCGLSEPNAASFRENLLSTLATTYTKKNEYAKAIEIRQGMMDSAPPHSSFAARMAGKIAFLHMDEGMYADAIPMWRKAIGMGGSGRQTAKWYLAWSYHMDGGDADAIAVIDEMLKEGGKKSAIHDRLLYWKARFTEKSNARAARDMYSRVIDERPGGYYAELASRRLASDVRDARNFVSLQSVPSDTQTTSGAIECESPPPYIARAIFFDNLGLREEAAREIEAQGLKTAPCSVDDLLSLAGRNFAHDIAYRYAEGGFGRFMKKSDPSVSSIDRKIWEAAFPRAYEPIVLKLTRKTPVDPALVWSIMRNESAFRPEVVSPAGAVGLMQLMPTTATRLSREAGGAPVDRRKLYRPAANIAWGVAYLKKLSALFPDNPVSWIASYNAGEEAVDRWLKNGSTNDIEAWIEEIPYDETNLYVKKVLVSYWKYKRLYGG